MRPLTPEEQVICQPWYPDQNPKHIKPRVTEECRVTTIASGWSDSPMSVGRWCWAQRATIVMFNGAGHADVWTTASELETVGRFQEHWSTMNDRHQALIFSRTPAPWISEYTPPQPGTGKAGVVRGGLHPRTDR